MLSKPLKNLLLKGYKYVEKLNKRGVKYISYVESVNNHEKTGHFSQA